MARRDEKGMWNMVLFDLPVQTKTQRREATKFRNILLDLGWTMTQFSVYVRYVPVGMSVAPEIQEIRRSIPLEGKVEVVAITDRQWSKAIRFFNSAENKSSNKPEQLTIL